MGLQRVTDLADPRRCKGRSLDGQCQNVAEEGSDFCRVHGGVIQAPARRLKQYLLTRPQDCERLAQFDDPEGHKSLRDEVLIATVTQTTAGSAGAMAASDIYLTDTPFTDPNTIV